MSFSPNRLQSELGHRLCLRPAQVPTGARKGTENRLGVRKTERTLANPRAHVTLANCCHEGILVQGARSQLFHKKPGIQILLCKVLGFKS